MEWGWPLAGHAAGPQCHQGHVMAIIGMSEGAAPPSRASCPAAATGCLACRRLDRCSAAPQLPQLHRAASEANAKLSMACLVVCAASTRGLRMSYHRLAHFCSRYPPVACPVSALALCNRCTRSRCIRLRVICVAGDRWHCLQRSRSRQLCEKQLRAGSPRPVGCPPPATSSRTRLPRVCDSIWSCECSDVESMLVS